MAKAVTTKVAADTIAAVATECSKPRLGRSSSIAAKLTVVGSSSSSNSRTITHNMDLRTGRSTALQPITTEQRGALAPRRLALEAATTNMGRGRSELQILSSSGYVGT